MTFSGKFLVGNVAWLVSLVLLVSPSGGVIGFENQWVDRFSLCN
jgi:hypothetical protein